MSFDSEIKTRELAAILRSTIDLPKVEKTPECDSDLIHFANRRHRVTPLLNKAIELQPTIVLDEESRDLSNIYNQANVRTVLQQQAVTKTIFDLLDKHTISCLLLKGNGLAKQLHGSAALRQSNDVDILIAPGKAKAALSILHENGFRSTGQKRKSNKSLDYARMVVGKDAGLRDPKFNQLVELHQRAVLFEPGNLSAELLRGSNSEKIPSIAVSHYAFYLLLHGALSFWKRLVWVADASVLVRKTSHAQRHEVISLSERYGCADAILASLQFIEEIFPDTLDQGWKEIVLNRGSKSDTKELRELYNNDLLRSHPDNVMGAPDRGGLRNPSWYVFRGNLSFWSMAPRRLATYAISKI